MTKAPRAGKVKTRLTPPLTSEEAAALNVCFLRDTAAAISAAQERGGAIGVGCYTPRGEERAYEGILPALFHLIPQRGDQFGERLLLATEDLFAVGFSAVCLINSDSPIVSGDIFAEAVSALNKPGDRVVLGPSEDGGYYLIGMKQAHRRLFEEIDWSTESVLPQTLERAHEIGVEVHLLPVSYDVDDRATLRHLCDDLFSKTDEANAAPRAPETRRYLEELIAREGRHRIWPI